MASGTPLFPLYLAPFELAMLVDGQAAYPMTFVVQVRLSGMMDRGAFEMALQGALARHPFLNALVERRKKNQLCWVSSDGLGPRTDWSDEGRPLALPDGQEAIDLASEVGLRIWVRRQGGETQLTLQFHHACCDGVGAYRFLGDLLALYGQMTSHGESELPRLAAIDLSRLRTRSRGVLDVALNGRRMRLARLAIGEAAKLLGGGVAELAAARQGGGQRLAPFPSLQSHTFDRATHEQLREAAMAQGGMLNDLLLAELFQAVRDWNERKTGRGIGKYRVLMPTDMRLPDNYETPAANQVSCTFVARRSKELDCPRSLVGGIRRETEVIKSERRGTRFADMLAGGFAVKGLMPLLAKYPFCMATAILSNVGDPSRRFTARFPRSEGRIVCGDLVLEEITGAPPLRRKSRAAISVFAYNRRLTISTRCDPFSFTPDDAQEFLRVYVARLRCYLLDQNQQEAAVFKQAQLQRGIGQHKSRLGIGG
jgi:hypothetical protein